MDIVIYTLILVLWALYIFFSADKPLPSEVSLFELKRERSGREAYAKKLDREERYKDILFMHTLVSNILLVSAILITVAKFGWLWGVASVVSALILISFLSTNKLVLKYSESFQKIIEPLFVKVSRKFKNVFKYIQKARLEDAIHDRKIFSKEELLYIVERSPDALSEIERKTMLGALSFADKKVRSIMVPIKDVRTIAKDEFLGPVVLDELHSSGFSRLPVVDGKDIVGMLYLRDLLSLDVKKSAKAEEFMDKKVYYVRDDDRLDRTLHSFLKTNHHLLVVIDDSSDPVGVISLEDVIEELIGQEIIDEDDIIV